METEKTMFNLADDKNERMIAKEYVTKLFKEDKETYDKILKLLKQIGIGNLWYGIDVAIKLTAEALKQGDKKIK